MIINYTDYSKQDYEKLAEDGRSIDEAELLDLSIKGDFGHDAACDFRIGFRYGHKRGHADGIKWARENPPPEVLELVEALKRIETANIFGDDVILFARETIKDWEDGE